MTLASMGGAIKTALEDVTSLAGHVHWLWPDTIITPAAIIVPSRGLDRQTFDGAGTQPFYVYLFAAPAQDGSNRGQEKALGYLEENGDSIRAAIESAIPQATVAAWENFDALKDWQGRTFWGARFPVEWLT